jgi:transcriptional regulator GlxA family with amidase domain
MPPAFKVCAGGLNASTTLTGVTSMLASEIGRRSFDSFTAQRLLEVLFAEALRAHQRDTDARAPGWFTGLADPKIAEALRSIHATAHESMSVAGLAAGVALSPSRFAARFKETMGETVMEYAGRWRANLACRLLAETDESLSVIAGKTGFGSLAAFSKAFKAKLGSAPATWRAMYRAQQVQAGSI